VLPGSCGWYGKGVRRSWRLTALVIRGKTTVMQGTKRPKLPRGLRWRSNSPFIWFSWRDGCGKQHQHSTGAEPSFPAGGQFVNG
jgi:hypothetical protein